MAYKVVLIQDELCDQFRIEIEQLCQGLYEILKVGETGSHGMQKNGTENVIIFDLAHGSDLMIIRMHLGKSIMKVFVIG